MPVTGSMAASLASALFVGAFLAAACSPADETGVPTDDDPVTVTVLMTDGTAELSMSPNADGPAKFLMFLPLVEAALDGSLEGRLADRWEPSADFTEWTIHLNPNLRWHDGMPVT